MSGSGVRPGGWPVWQALVALMLLPLMAAGIMGGVSVASANRSADGAVRAERLVTAVELLDAARQSVDAEILPTLLLGVLRDQRHAEAVGFDAPRRAVLLVTEPARLDQVRLATDQAMDAVAKVSGVPHLDAVVVAVRAEQRSVRALADDGAGGLQPVVSRYAAIIATLSSEQLSASAEAISAGLSTRSVLALQDLDRVVQLSETASGQLAQLFASRVLPQPGASKARTGWVASWGTYTHLLTQSAELSSDSTRAAWTVFRQTADVTTFSGFLNRQALDPSMEVLATGALPGLAALSGRRDNAVAVVLSVAVGAVTATVGADRATAVNREQLMIEICLGLGLLSLLDAGFVARWLATSMRSLATSAQRISEGHLVDVAARGPRELRTAAYALSSAVGGLRRVQEQARAVVAGDLETALRQEALPGPLGEVVQASVEQIVEAFRAREVLQDELTYQASHDALTGIANRAQSLRHLSAGLERRQDHADPVGVLFIDLDGFKAVNDAFGHAAGDELLTEVARRLSADLRGGDVTGRLGGDEFVVIIENVATVAELIRMGERLIAQISAPMQVHVGLGAGADSRKQVGVGASVGITLSSPDSTPDELLAEADIAAYRAKRLGRGRVEVFDDLLRAELAEQSQLQSALREALAARELHLHYQPVVSLSTGHLVGYEALARWSRPGIGPVSPDVFIAVAETSTLVCDLGRWVLTEATSQLARWQQAGQGGFGRGEGEPTIAVNLSGRHLLDPRVLADVSDALSASGLTPASLVLEITETVLTNGPSATQHLQDLRALGVRVAIDDFGTGYTSISALSTTPADILKIDRSFVATDDPARHELATLITRAAHTLSLRVVVEGIETPEQLARARADGCDEAQGYLFSRPLAPEAVDELPHPLLPPEPGSAPSTTPAAGLPGQRRTTPQGSAA